MGRQRLKLAFIVNLSKRRHAFKKKMDNLLKKSYELNVLTRTRVRIRATFLGAVYVYVFDGTCDYGYGSCDYGYDYEQEGGEEGQAGGEEEQEGGEEEQEGGEHDDDGTADDDEGFDFSGFDISVIDDSLPDLENFLEEFSQEQSSCPSQKAPIDYVNSEEEVNGFFNF
ncbi:type I MADS-box transcription factor [Selaginella moellendorffii]|uniref:Type I MADS-box transcription factor n=1 Tax=Selaginella moellendorffii TaxID=88036 RepID=D8S5E6_SELML|nr:type I MADS-box transcription factor [Selaginella moellendorffii]